MLLLRKPVHLEAGPGDVAPLVVAVGDPGRAERLATGLLEDARLVSSARGLKVYTGSFNGSEVTIATHGIGGPSAAVVFEELRMLGAEVLVRLGTSGGLSKDLRLGDVVVAAGAGCYWGSGGSIQYAGERPMCLPASPDPILTAGIYRGLSSRLGDRVVLAPVMSSDAFYAETPEAAGRWRSLGMAAVEMELHTLFSISWIRGFRSAGVLIVSDLLLPEGFKRITPGELARREVEVGRALLEVLTGGV
nr:purine-nucleoside phosphorylase [Aeropyrum pernix]